MAAITVHDFLRSLEDRAIAYSMTSVREGAVMVQIALPGERWEVEFFDDRPPEAEVFRSDGSIFGPDKLGELLSAGAA